MGPRLTWLDAPAGADESCYIDTVLGIVSVLRAIAIARTRTSAYIENGTRLVHTTLLGLDEDPPALFFEKGPDEALNARVLDSDRIVFVTSDQGVPVQFSCLNPHLASYGALDAFSVRLPARVLRLQRRSYYRLSAEPSNMPLQCEIAVKSGDEASTQVLKPEVLDISCGGLGTAVPDTEPLLAPGTRSGCRVELPGVGRIETLVEVRAASDIMLRGGRHGRRYGMNFVNLAARSVTAIQRYILEQQRSRKRLTA